MSSANNNGQEIIPVAPIRPSPDWETVRQTEPVMHAVPVEVVGVVAASSAPAKRATGHNYSLLVASPNGPTPVIPGDPKIKNVVALCVTAGQSVLMGTKEQVNQPSGADGFLLTAGIPVTLEGFEVETFAVAAGNATTVLSLWITYWAD